MKNCFCIIFTFFFCNLSIAQTTYESPLGFSLSFDKTWKRLPKEVLQQRMKDVKDFLEYRKDIQFDACYQKIGNAEMDYPYILFKNVYATVLNKWLGADDKEILGNQYDFMNFI